VKHAFHLSCPNREELITRLRQRALHDNRLDDANEAVIRKRLRTYELETRPMLEFYGVKVTIIDATEPPIKVLNDITSIIWSKQRKVAA
jgi:adenylate kinase